MTDMSLKCSDPSVLGTEHEKKHESCFRAWLVSACLSALMQLCVGIQKKNWDSFLPGWGISNEMSQLLWAHAHAHAVLAEQRAIGRSLCLCADDSVRQLANPEQPRDSPWGLGLHTPRPILNLTVCPVCFPLKSKSHPNWWRQAWTNLQN